MIQCFTGKANIGDNVCKILLQNEFNPFLCLSINQLTTPSDLSRDPLEVADPSATPQNHLTVCEAVQNSRIPLHASVLTII